MALDILRRAKKRTDLRKDTNAGVSEERQGEKFLVGRDASGIWLTKKEGTA